MKRNLMRNSILFILILLCVSCNTQSDGVISKERYQELLKQSVMIIPDSLRTDEQRQLYVKLLDILVDNAYAEDNKIVLPVSRDYFVEQGVPDFYYDLLKYSLEETNACVEMWNKQDGVVTNADSLFRIYKEKYKAGARDSLLKNNDYCI